MRADIFHPDFIPEPYWWQAYRPASGEPSHSGVESRWPAAALWRTGEPEVRKITTADVWEALARGYDDFRAIPTHAFICLIYPVAGLILFRLSFGYEILPLLYPMIAGFALLGPFVAIGLYELSRRREQGLRTLHARRVCRRRPRHLRGPRLRPRRPLFHRAL